jgi:hypothetical protein
VNAAFGLKARTGRALLVVLAGSIDAPRVLERSQLPLLPAGVMAPYHAAEALEPEAARRSVRRSIAIAHRLAASGIDAVLKRIVAGGHSLSGCAVLIGKGMPDWSTQDILAVHVRMHQAEGELFREVLVAGARAAGIEPACIAEKSALTDAAARLGIPEAVLALKIADLGKQAGPPWGKDQKEAAAAALVALQGA